jgi:hypothetical protein
MGWADRPGQQQAAAGTSILSGQRRDLAPVRLAGLGLQEGEILREQPPGLP